MKRTSWMEGLLWAENFIQKGKIFKGDTSWVKSLQWELYYSREFSDDDDSEWFKGASDYLEFYKTLK